jgi:glucose/arabinose dehydrogenase
MMKLRFHARRVTTAIALMGIGACGSDSPLLIPGDPTDEAIEFVSIGNFNSPVFLTSPEGDARLFIVEQDGRIVIVDNGQTLATPFLDITSKVGCCGEQGLLSAAFHPDYASNGQFFVSYTNNNGNTVVERYDASADPNVADGNSGFTVFTLTQPFPNHNGGMILFGPDDMLYIGLGDGGSGNDPLDSGQDLTTMLGAILRIDVDGGAPYAVPSDNPFVGQPQAQHEIWHYGLRNPWRFSFDRGDGSMWIGDVGQNAWEEVTMVPAGAKGLNLGWKIMEGSHCRSGTGCDMTGLTLPQLDFPNPADGCSVIGGYVYRGNAFPDIRGHYFYSDLCGGWLRSFRLENGSPVDLIDWDQSLSSPVSFGEDSDGELYVLTGGGEVMRVTVVAAS